MRSLQVRHVSWLCMHNDNDIYIYICPFNFNLIVNIILLTLKEKCGRVQNLNGEHAALAICGLLKIWLLFKISQNYCVIPYYNTSWCKMSLLRYNKCTRVII